MRVMPRPLVGVLVLLAYLAVFYGVWILGGIDYTHIGDSAATLLKWYVAPLACGAAVLVIAVSALGWWRPSLFESTPRAPRWALVPGGLMVVFAAAQLAAKDFSATTGQMWVYLALGSIGVGFCEELATRGQLITALRGRLTEPMVWLWSSVAFGLLHLPNAFFGAGLGAISQVVLAMCLGTSFYLVRRATGSLIWAMLLHGLWDFSTFAGTNPPAWMAAVTPLIALVALGGAWALLRKERGARLGLETSQNPELAPA